MVNRQEKMDNLHMSDSFAYCKLPVVCPHLCNYTIITKGWQLIFCKTGGNSTVSKPDTYCIKNELLRIIVYYRSLQIIHLQSGT